MFDLGEISAKRFFAEFWRKKPLFLRGGAKLLLEQDLSIADFRMICDRMERTRPRSVIRRQGCIFAERIDRASPPLRSAAEAHEQRLSCRHIWFDGAYTTSGRGADSHSDRSDCFLLSQLGSERWRLCPPEVLSPKELRARMLADGTGRVHMPDECHEYLVEAGDLLYVPLLWGHWGVPEGGPSLTLSLVIEANNALDTLLPALSHVLAEDRAWWHPLPQIPIEDTISGKLPATVEHCFDVLLQSFSKADFAKRAKSIWWREGYLHPHRFEPAPRQSSARRTRSDDAGLDRDRIARLLDNHVKPPDPDGAALPGDRASAQLELLLARRVMRDFFDLTLASRATFGDAPAVQPLLDLAAALQHADLSVIAPLVARPEVTSWVWRLSEALAFKQASYFEEIANPATRLLFPALLTVREHLRDTPMPINRSHERGINLLSARRRIASPVPLGTRMNVALVGSLLRFSSAAGTLVEFPVEALAQRGTSDASTGFFVEDLPATAHGAIVVLERDAWMFGQYPRGGRFGARPLADEPLDGLTAAIDQHAHAIEQAWPELGRELETLIKVALPLSGRDAKAQTAPPFLGAVAVNQQARPADLVEELGRTKARLVAGLAFDRPLRSETRERFEESVANAYRRAYEELAGIEHPALRSAEPPMDELSPWGKKFIGAVHMLMK